MQKPILRRGYLTFKQQKSDWSPGDYYVPSKSDKNLEYQSIVPGTMLKNYWENFFNTSKSFWNPLNSKKYCYPPEVEEMLKDENKNCESKNQTKNSIPNINMNNNIYWCFKDKKLIIWQYGGNQQNNKKEYINPHLICITEFDLHISAVQIKTISNIPQILEGSHKIVVVAFCHSMQLFRLGTSQIESLNVVIKSSFYGIKKIIIQTSKNQSNQNLFLNGHNPFETIIEQDYQKDQNKRINFWDIVYSDAAGNIGVFDLVKRKNYDSKPYCRRMFKNYKKQQMISNLLQIVINQTQKGYLKIHCLVKYKGKQKSNNFCDFNFCDWILSLFEQQKICTVIKSYLREKNKVYFNYSTSQSALVTKLKQSYQQFFETQATKQQKKQLNICSIAYFKNDLKIIFEQGLAIITRDHNYLAFLGSICVIQNLPNINGFGILLPTTQKNSNQNICFACQNAAISKSCLISEGAYKMYHTSLRHQEDSILLFKSISDSSFGHFFTQNQRWITFNKKFIRIYTAMKPTDLILLYISILYQLRSLQQITNKTNQKINQKIKIFVQVWGQAPFMVYIIELLAQKNSYKLEISNQNYQLARFQITQKQRQYNQGIKIIRISKDIFSFLQDLVLHYTKDKYNPHILIKKQSIWHALNLIFSQVLFPIRHVNSIHYSQNSQKMHDLKERLQLLMPVLQLINSHHNKNGLDLQQRRRYQNESFFFPFQSQKKNQISQEMDYFNKKQDKQSFKSNINDVTKDTIYDQKTLIAQNLILKVCKKMIIAIPKIKMLIDIYMTLSQCDKREKGLPKLENVLIDRESRRDLAEIVVDVFKYNNQPLLNSINQIIPQLNLQQIRAFHLWKARFLFNRQEQKNFSFSQKTVQHPTINSMANILYKKNYNIIHEYYTNENNPEHCFLIEVLLKKIELLKREALLLQFKQKSNYLGLAKDEVETVQQSYQLQYIYQINSQIDIYEQQIIVIAEQAFSLYQKNKKNEENKILSLNIISLIEEKASNNVKKILQTSVERFSISLIKRPSKYENDPEEFFRRQFIYTQKRYN